MTRVLMLLQCGPVTDNAGGVQKDYTGKEYINKEIRMNAIYGNGPEDNTYAQATPWAELKFALTNPLADIFVPNKRYRLTIELEE